MPRIARAVGLGGGDGPGVVRKLPQVLAELAQKVLCGLCRSALHDQTLQLGPLFLDPLAGLRQPFLDAVGADGLYHGYLQPQPTSDRPRPVNDNRRHFVPNGASRTCGPRQERKRQRCQRLSSRYADARWIKACARWNAGCDGIVSSHTTARALICKLPRVARSGRSFAFCCSSLWGR